MMGNFYVISASDADEGLILAKIEQPDIILLDIIMPTKGSPEIAEDLRADPATRFIPIIFITAIVKENEMQKRKGLIGGHAFMAKPVQIDDLIGKISVMTQARH